MNITVTNILLIGSILLFVSVFVGKAGYKLGLPALLLFLFVGMIFGSDGLGYQFNDPYIARFIGTIALSIILFSGGMDTKYKEIKPIFWQGVTLSTAGVFLTTIFTGGFIYYIARFFDTGFELSIAESMLLAAVMSSTDSASVFSILRSRRRDLKENLRPLIEFESGSNDPMAYMLTVTLIGISSSFSLSAGEAIILFISQMGIGFAVGFVMGHILVSIINKINLTERSLYVVILIAGVFFTYSFADKIGGNGFLAVYIAGLIVGNKKVVFKNSLTNFFDGITWLVQIIMFIALGLLVTPSNIIPTAGIGMTIALFLIIIARPLAVMLCLSPFRGLSAKGKLYISWVGLRGAVPIIFATYPMMANIGCANLIFNVVFFITIVSLLIQGTTVDTFARILKLSNKQKTTLVDIDVLTDELRHLITELVVDDDLLLSGDMIKDVYIPYGCRILVIKRNQKYIVPKGNTIIKKDDILILIRENNKKDVKKIR